MNYPVNTCRIDHSELQKVVDLGSHPFSGIFPCPNENVPEGPLQLGIGKSGMLQLMYNFDPELMYGDNYGYRSSLNSSMVSHIEGKAKRLYTNFLSSNPTAICVDIGSNDGTLLNHLDLLFSSSYSSKNYRLYGIDPTINSFKKYYNTGIETIPAFFGNQCVSHIGKSKVSLVTSLSMFYDLPNPIEFACNIYDLLSDTGVWHFEQSYLVSMLENNSYDTICHEHIEYYSLHSIKLILDNANLKIIDISTNDVNGGSIAVTAAKKDSPYDQSDLLDWYLKKEHDLNLTSPDSHVYTLFNSKIAELTSHLNFLLSKLNKCGDCVYGLGASTKGNTILRQSQITSSLLPAIFDVNSDKFGRVTPGSQIPIIDELLIPEIKPDYLLLLPWHFKSSLLSKLRSNGFHSCKLILPLPTIQIIQI